MPYIANTTLSLIIYMVDNIIYPSLFLHSWHYHAFPVLGILLSTPRNDKGMTEIALYFPLESTKERQVEETWMLPVAWNHLLL